MSFKTKKEATLNKLKYYLENDEIDRPIIELLKDLNSIDKLFTTSSCSGRILVLIDRGKKIDSEKYLTFHDYISLSDIENIPRAKNVWLRVEPFILHIIAQDQEMAETIIKLARSVGIKRGGMSKVRVGYMIEIIGNVHFAAPTNKLIIDEELVGILNNLMRRNFRMLEKFHLSVKELIDKIDHTGND